MELAETVLGHLGVTEQTLRGAIVVPQLSSIMEDLARS